MRKNKKRPEGPIRKTSREEYVDRIRRQTRRAKYGLRKSFMLVIIGVLAFSVAITASLYKITVKDHKKYSEMAANTHTARYPIYPARGNIRSADGKDLAISTFTYTVGVTPGIFGPSKNSDYTQAQVEEKVAKILDIDLLKFRQDLKENEDAAYMVVKKEITAEKNDELNAFLDEAKVYGMRQDANQARYYPQGDLASTIVGFANKRDKNIEGVIGIESYYNSLLGGKPGYYYGQVDNYWGQTLPNTSQIYVPAEDGYDLELTIQSDLQAKAQELSRQAAEVTNSLNGAQMLVLDAKTGAILAMAGDNYFDLNDPMEAPYNVDPKSWDPSKKKEQLDYLTGTYWYGKSASQPYEVGSTFKPFVLGMALDEGTITPDSIVSDEFVYIEGWPEAISSYDDMSKGDISISYAIWDSRNPPFVRIAQGLGLDTFYKYISRLGLREKTGLDVAGENVGLVHQEPQEIDMAVTAFGEQITMTGLRLATDYVMLANNGAMLRPYLVQRVVDADGEIKEEHQPEVIRNVYSADTAEKVRQIMVGVGRYGTGQKLYVTGVESAYKTGTSTRNLHGGHSDDTETRNYVTLMPADNPRYVIYSATHDIKRQNGWPLEAIHRQMEEYIAYRDDMPFTYKAYDLNKIFSVRYTADAVGKDFTEGQKALMWQGIYPVLDSGLKPGKTIQSQYPPAGGYCAYDSRVWVSDKANALPDEWTTMEDFTGLTLENAKKQAQRLGLNVVCMGGNRAGTVTDQEVSYQDLAGGSKPGDLIRKYSTVVLYFYGDDNPGPYEDDSLTYGMNDGTGALYGY
jgi:stage V sporulation protein D (sporulation-specific penicillin-binding protein)